MDLAGSERISRTQSSGSRLDEAKYINRSLSVLGHVISGLASNNSSTHIPFRDSKLTRILKNVLQGNSNTVLITTISPSLNSFSETLSSLKFAQRCMKVHINPIINERDNSVSLRLQEQIAALQSADFIRSQQQQMLDRNRLKGATFSPQNQESKNVQNNRTAKEKILASSSRESRKYDKQDKFSSFPSPTEDNELDILVGEDGSPLNHGHSDLEEMWGVVAAMYDTLWEIHEMSINNLHQSIFRMQELDENWDQNTEMHRNDPVLRDIHIDVKNRYPIQLLNSSGYSSMLDSFLSQRLTKKGPAQSDSVEEFISEIAQIHRAVAGQLLCVSRFLEVRDLQSEDMKQEIVSKEIDSVLQDHEIGNWNDVLIRTLKTNSSKF